MPTSGLGLNPVLAKSPYTASPLPTRSAFSPLPRGQLLQWGRKRRLRPCVGWILACSEWEHLPHLFSLKNAAAAAANSLQSCPTLCNPQGWQPTRLPHPWDSPGKNTGVGCHFLLQCRKVKSESEVTQSCLTLSDPMDYSLPGSSVHGIFQAKVLEWGAIAFSNWKMHRLLKLVVQYPSRVLIKFSMIFDKSYGFSKIYLCNFFLLLNHGIKTCSILWGLTLFTF